MSAPNVDPRSTNARIGSRAKPDSRGRKQALFACEQARFSQGPFGLRDAVQAAERADDAVRASKFAGFAGRFGIGLRCANWQVSIDRGRFCGYSDGF